MQPHKTFQRQILTLASWTLVIIVLLLGGTLVAGTMKVYHNTCVIEKERDSIRSSCDSLRLEFYRECNRVLSEGNGSVAGNNRVTYNDSIISAQLKQIYSRIGELESRQDDSINDIRQETNNIINKVNGWIGFWIAILAIFGGGLPLIIQYVQTKKTRLALEDMLEEINVKTANTHMQLLVSTLWVDRNCSVIADSDIRHRVYSIVISEASSSLQEIIKCLEEQGNVMTERNKLHLINALVQCFRLIDVIKLSTKGNLRRLNEVQTSISTLLKDLFNLGEHDESEIIRRIHDLVSRLADIH